mgnify:CR=1 FL=1
MCNLLDMYNERFEYHKKVGMYKSGNFISLYHKSIDKKISKVKGLCISYKNNNRLLKIKTISKGVIVEHSFPVCSPLIISIRVMFFGYVKQSKIYYMRELLGKLSRIKTKKIQAKKIFFTKSNYSHFNTNKNILSQPLKNKNMEKYEKYQK